MISILLQGGAWPTEPGWWIGLSANAVISVAFLAVAVLLAVNAIKTRQVKHNPLGLAVVILYIGCGGGHVVHTWQLLDVALGYNTVFATAAAFEYTSDWHMWLIDIFTMIAGVSYWMMRRRFPALVSGAAVFEDLRDRQRRALEIHDNVVQGLARAKLALDLDAQEEGDAALDETLAQAKMIITDLLGNETVKPGSLRRRSQGGGPDGV